MHINFSDDLFEGCKPTRERLTHSQNRKEHRVYGLERAKDKPGRAVGADTVLGITSRDLRRLQEEDTGLLREQGSRQRGRRRM